MRQPKPRQKPGNEQHSRNSVTASVQMNKKRDSFELPNLAALLDGEISDEQNLSEIGSLLSENTTLKEEFDRQRDVKRLLGGLPEYEAPPFLATRVIGEIATRRKLQRSHRMRSWFAAAGGFAMCLLLAGLLFTPISPFRPVNLGQPMLAQEVKPITPEGMMVKSMDDEFLHGSWSSELPVSDDEELDPQMKQFLEFVNEAHGYRVMMRQGTALSPDMPEAVMVLGEQQPAEQ